MTRPGLTFRLPLDSARLLRARHRIRDYLHEWDVAAAVIEDVVLAVEEAMTNAVRHSGAREDLHVSLSFRGDDLIASVRDQGKGFEVDSFDPQRLPDLDKASGRGLYLISRLMDDFELRRGDGLEVWMAKRDALAGPLLSPPRGGRGFTSLPGAQVHRDVRERAMLDEIDDAFLAFDWEYRLIHVNAAALRLIDRPSQELLGHTLWSLFPYAPPHPAGDAAMRAMQLGAPSTVEYESRRAGRWVKLRIYPASFGISVFARDISERKRNEQAQARQYLALRGVNAILQAALTTTTEEELGRVCLRVAEAVTDSPLGLIARLGEDGLLHDVAVSESGRSSCSMDDQSGHHRSQSGFAGGGLNARLLAVGETVVANAPGEHPDSTGVPFGHPALTAYLGVR